VDPEQPTPPPDAPRDDPSGPSPHADDAGFGPEAGAIEHESGAFEETLEPVRAWSDLENSGPIGFFHIAVLEERACFSAAWKRLLGYAPEGLPDDPNLLVSLIHPDDSDAAPDRAARAAPSSTGGFSVEVRLRANGGAWQWVHLAGVRQFDEDGDLRSVTGIMLDVEERRESEEQALRNEERFLRLTGRAGAGFFELDFATRTGWFSPAFRHALGWPPGEETVTLERFGQALAAPGLDDGLEAFVAACAPTPGAALARLDLRHRDGRTLAFDVLLVADRGRQGAIVRACGITVPRQEAPPAAGEDGPAASGLSLLALGQALDAVAEAVLVIDRAGIVVHANARAAHLLGLPPAQLHGGAIDALLAFVDRTTGAPVSGLVGRILDGGAALDLDHGCALAASGSAPEPVVLTCRPVLDARGAAAGAVLIVRKPAEMPLSPAELLASNRMESLGRLACGVAHDFNNLLTTVSGGISLAADKHDWAPLAVAQKACTNAKDLARQLLAFARGEASGKKVVSANTLLRETARIASAGSRTIVEFELDDAVHPVLVDTAQFVQVFTNLILNAIQAMPGSGRIWIRTADMPLGQINSVSLPAGDYVRIDIQDNGPGIPPENLERIFEPFFTTRAEGTGLGLAMVRSIVAQHEGAIDVASTVGSGTTFTLYLPQARHEAAVEPPRPAVVGYGTGRVLVMDDDPDLCTIVQGMLELLGYQAEVATSAADAIALFRRNFELGQHYAAVILDLTMAGGLGGEEVLIRLRELDPNVRAIVSSGYAAEERAGHYRKLGFTGILAKPYRSADLGRVLKDVLKPAS
jgi:PAS domain S-box-containing protein